jgi:hypothetical protein
MADAASFNPQLLGDVPNVVAKGPLMLTLTHKP